MILKDMKNSIDIIIGDSYAEGSSVHSDENIASIIFNGLMC